MININTNELTQVWEGEGEAYAKLTIYLAKDGRYFGSLQEKKIPYASESLYDLEADTFEKAQSRLWADDADLYWYATAYAEEG